MPAFLFVERSAGSLRLFVLVGIALAIGFLAGRYGWLAAGGAYVVGIALWTLLYLKPSPPWAPSDNWGEETWLGFAASTVFGVVLYALFGIVGSWIPIWRARLAAR